MSNTQDPYYGTEVTARPGNVSVHNNTAEHEITAHYPDGSQGVLKVRTSNDRSPTADEEYQTFLLTIDPNSLTERLEKEMQDLNVKLEDFSGYDKQGQPILRYTGRERQLMEYQYGTRRNALIEAQKTRALAERVQAEARRNQTATAERIEAAAQAQAQKLIEQAEIDRRAKQIAARAGVRD